MKDLSTGSIPKHLISMSVPIAVGMFVQTLYYLVDLYFVARLGDVALAGVSAAGNAMFVNIALTQILGVGSVALIAQAVGRKERDDVNLIFNQSLLLAVVLGAVTLIGGYFLAEFYMRGVAADLPTTAAGVTYLYWFTPCMALQFAIVAMSSALRGTGIVKPTMVVQLLTVVINIILAPVLIAGWFTGLPMGIAGAGLASSIAALAGVVMLWFYFRKFDNYIVFDRTQWRPRLGVWKKMLWLGVPVGGEFLLMFVYMASIYWAISDFGVAAQAGFGIGSRMMQALFLPAMAVAFAAPAIAGQNVGAGQFDRVRDTFRWATIVSVGIMLVLLVFCQLRPLWLILPFTNDPDVVDVSKGFLTMISWNFLFSGVVFVCSGMFQGLGNTWPAMLSTASRLITFVPPLIWLSYRDGFEIVHVWYLSVATVVLQCFLSLWLLRGEFQRRLSGKLPSGVA
ncbi:MAG: MATE family efflux transporter [Gammaproteobacteria bacterium]